MDANSTLRRQLEVQEEENRRLRSRFMTENNQLKEMLLQLTDELSKLQSRLRDQSPSRQRTTPQTSSAQSEVAASPTQPVEPTIYWPTRTESADQSTQCGPSSFSEISVQCDILGSLDSVALMTPERPTSIENHRRVIEAQSLGGDHGLVSTPGGVPKEDADVPSLAREADRLLSVITKLRAERNTPQPIGRR